MLTHFKTQLEKKLQLTNDVYLLTFKLIEPQQISFVAGQYMISLIPQGGGQFIRRLYSIASPPTGTNSFQLLIKVVPDGKGSNYLTSLKEGAEMFFDGPAGIFTLKDQKNPVFLATGTGLAPFRSMIKKIQSQPSDIKKYTLFWGLANITDLCLLNELKEFAKKDSRFSYYICLSREISLEKINPEDQNHFVLGRINVGLDKYLSSLTDATFNICGNREVVETLRSYLAEKGIKNEQIYFEKF